MEVNAARMPERLDPGRSKDRTINEVIEEAHDLKSAFDRATSGLKQSDIPGVYIPSNISTV